MKKLIYGGIFLFTIGIGILSCQKENSQNVKNDQSAKLKIEHADMYIPLSQEQIENIGNLHNKYLTEFFADFDYEAMNREQEFKDIYSKYASDSGINIDWKDLTLGIEDNLNIIKENLSENAYGIIIKGINDSYNIEDYSSFINKINKLELEAMSNLIGKDLDATLITLCVLKKSASFWLPINKGGIGVGDNILMKIENSNKQGFISKMDGKGTLAADGAAAGGGFIVGAFGAAIAGGPLGWGFLVGVGARAAVASGWYAVSH